MMPISTLTIKSLTSLPLHINARLALSLLFMIQEQELILSPMILQRE